MKVAALDLGSNTFLLLICEIENGRVTQLYIDETEVVRLAQGMDAHRRFHPEALERAKQCLGRYSEIIRQYKPEKVMAVATSAARDAANKDDFISILNDLNIPLRIIEGSKEAELTYLGSIFDQNPKGQYAIIDVGGGSTEVIGRKGDKITGRSVDVGSVRLTERLCPDQPWTSEQLQKLRETVEKEFVAVKNELPQGEDLQVIAVAGTPVALAQVEQGIEFDEEKLHGHELSLQTISSWCERLAPMTIEERHLIKGMPFKRADVLVAGCAVLEGALKVLNKDRLMVSTKGVRYGLALKLAEDAVTGQNSFL